MTVLILAREFDPTADAVVGALAQRQVPVFRTDLSDFPSRLWLDAQLRDGRWSGRLWTDHREVELGGVRSIWNRNPSTYAWKVAAECGLRVADTVITNNPASALRFVDRRDATITKALGPSGITEDGQVKVAYTRRLTGHDAADLGCVPVTATTLQRFVPKAFEVRLTVIGHSRFPIAIHAATESAHTDWRSDPSALTYEFVPVPDNVAAGVSRYMKRMNLAYAGLDFVVTPNDEEWVMLEANSGRSSAGWRLRPVPRWWPPWRIC